MACSEHEWKLEASCISHCDTLTRRAINRTSRSQQTAGQGSTRSLENESARNLYVHDQTGTGAEELGNPLSLLGTQ